MMTEGVETPTSSGLLLLGGTEYVTVVESIGTTYSIPTALECRKPSSEAPPPPKTSPLKPVKVDNWGIYLLQRLHSFYEKGDHTDLVLRFPAYNDLIHIHRLVFEAATDWLIPHQTEVAKGIIDMPHNFTPDAVRPVVNFMYTGRLDTGNACYDKIKETAELLRMSVLIKLIDDAKTRTNEPSPSKKKTLDPVKQIKRIKTIEKKFAENERRFKIFAAKERERRLEEQNRLPGKKLPIWKKRTIPVVDPHAPRNNSENTTTLPIQSSNAELPPVHPELEKNLLNNIDHEEIAATSNPNNFNPESELCLSSKDNSQNDSQNQSLICDGEIQSPQIPTIIYKRKTSELEMNQRGTDTQQTVLFDHVRETGSKKQTKSVCSLSESSTSEDNAKPLNDIDESMKELLEEQRKRLTLRHANSDNEEEDHHHDDYVGGDDEYYLGEIDDENNEITSQPSSELPKPVAKKSLPESEPVPVVPAKVVRFSLTPSANSSFNNKIQNTIFDEVKTNMGSNSLDLPPPASESLSQPSTMPPTMPTDSSKNNSKPSSKCDTVIKVYSDSGDKKQVISEVLKKNPGLLKSYRQVKLKIMTKNSDNKQSVQYVTLRASDCQVNIPPVIKNPPEKRLTEKRIRIISNLNGDYKHSPKVMYTGRRGRPKQIKEGEFDPHEQVRQEIDQRLSRNGFYGAKIKQDSKIKASSPIVTQAFQASQTLESTPIESTIISQQPSSEAEAMSKVASDIAASINLVPPDFVEGSASSNGVTNFMGTSHSFPVSMNEEVVSKKEVSSDLPKKNDLNFTEERSTDLDKVSTLVLEWDEEDEEEEQKKSQKSLI